MSLFDRPINILHKFDYTMYFLYSPSCYKSSKDHEKNCKLYNFRSFYTEINIYRILLQHKIFLYKYKLNVLLFLINMHVLVKCVDFLWEFVPHLSYSGSSNSVPENIPQVPLRIHAVPESTSSVITSSCLGFTVRWRHANCNSSLW